MKQTIKQTTNKTSETKQNETKQIETNEIKIKTNRKSATNDDKEGT